MNEAVEHQLDRTNREIVFRVVSAYYDVLLAAKELDVAEQSVRTAQAILDWSQTRFDSGLTVESDLLTAKVDALQATKAGEQFCRTTTAPWCLAPAGRYEKANTIFERLWNADVIDHVQITVAEMVGGEGRGD